MEKLKHLGEGFQTTGYRVFYEQKIKGKTIEANWDGLSKSEIARIKKYSKKKIFIKQGVPFTPGFLFGFIALLYLLYRFPNWF